MTMPRRLFLALVAAAWMTAAPGPLLAQGSADRPGKFIESMADKAIQALTAKDITRPERVRRFRELLHQHFDVKTIGRWVLGRHWTTATPTERDEYMSLFEDLIVLTYVDRFTEYSGERLTVTKSEDVGNGESVVASRIVRAPGETPIKVDWRLRFRDGQYRIIDVTVEGISMGMTQRSEFTSAISQNGGTIEGLLARLREKRKDI